MVEVSNWIYSEDWREIFMKQSVNKCRYINFCNLCVTNKCSWAEFSNSLQQAYKMSLYGGSWLRRIQDKARSGFKFNHCSHNVCVGNWHFSKTCHTHKSYHFYVYLLAEISVSHKEIKNNALFPESCGNKKFQPFSCIFASPDPISLAAKYVSTVNKRLSDNDKHTFLRFKFGEKSVW